MGGTTRSRKPPRQWRLGLIGAGRFGGFVLESLSGWERVRPVAVVDRHPSQAVEVAKRFDLVAYDRPEHLLSQPDIDLVLIATQPDSHSELTCQALGADKHVVCEKPLALSVDQADRAVALAHAKGRLLAVNHMLRYSPLLQLVDEIIRSRLLGEPLHFLFENYAEDEHLPETHWYWDPQRSGGIFTEHAVHFFDVQRWWFGPGEVLAAHAQHRAGPEFVDRVWCELRHGEVLGHQYHGFDQPKRLDRADHRVLFERGDLTVQGWIPMELRLHGIVDDDQQDRLRALCHQCDLEVAERYGGPDQQCVGRGKEYHVTARVVLSRRLTEPRQHVYGAMIKALFADQLDSLDHPGHVPRARAEDAREAVAMAVAATRMTGPQE
jgi:predicted dehydrogenase